MSYSAEAADQIVRMSLNGVEVAAKISGKAAERLAVLIYTILKGQKKTKGKIRLTNMLKSGKELRIFAVRDADLYRFCEEAKKYGVLYCVLKDKKANDGLVDIMVRAEDASKVNRIFKRFNLANIDMASVQTQLEREQDTQTPEQKPVPERAGETCNDLDEFLSAVVAENPTAETGETQNPTMARETRSDRYEPSSEHRDVSDRSEDERSSVRRDLHRIRSEMKTDEHIPGRNDTAPVQPKVNTAKGSR